jgi:hypothetical protein
MGECCFSTTTFDQNALVNYVVTRARDGLRQDSQAVNFDMSLLSVSSLFRDTMLRFTGRAHGHEGKLI